MSNSSHENLEFLHQLQNDAVIDSQTFFVNHINSSKNIEQPRWQPYVGMEFNSIKIEHFYKTFVIKEGFGICICSGTTNFYIFVCSNEGHHKVTLQQNLSLAAVQGRQLGINTLGGQVLKEIFNNHCLKLPLRAKLFLH